LKSSTCSETLSSFALMITVFETKTDDGRKTAIKERNASIINIVIKNNLTPRMVTDYFIPI